MISKNNGNEGGNELLYNGQKVLFLHFPIYKWWM